MATHANTTATPVSQGEKPASKYPEHHLPFVSRNEIEGGINLWGVPPKPDYHEAWHEGEYRAIVLLNAIADNRYQAPDVLRRVACDQVAVGLLTSGHKGAILGFWNTVAQLIIPCLNPDNVARLAAQIVERRCASMALSTVGEIELKAEYRRIALKAAATRRARTGKAVRS
jgi:hypothetical protein